MTERRLNLLTGDWVLVSPHRLSRPWLGASEAPDTHPARSYDPDCYLCPSNARAGGQKNPPYEGVFVFDNDFSALAPDATFAADPSDPLFVSESEHGICRVICYTPDHSRALSQLTPREMRDVVDAWAEQSRALSHREDIAAVTIFENRGAMMGASNPHPHGQIWATSRVPNELARETGRQRAWMDAHGEPLLSAYLRRETEKGTRVVHANDSFAAVVPYWAVWPFETIMIPRRATGTLDTLTSEERNGLADAFLRLTRAYDALFAAPFPYTMGFHQQAPTDASAHFVLHAHFYPPLLRSASVRKHMVGFEMLAMPQRDLTPERAAEMLRAVL